MREGENKLVRKPQSVNNKLFSSHPSQKKKIFLLESQIHLCKQKTQEEMINDFRMYFDLFHLSILMFENEKVKQKADEMRLYACGK